MTKNYTERRERHERMKSYSKNVRDLYKPDHYMNKNGRKMSLINGDIDQSLAAQKGKGLHFSFIDKAKLPNLNPH